MSPRRRQDDETPRPLTWADVPEELAIFDADEWPGGKAEWLAARDRWAADHGANLVRLLLDDLRRRAGRPPVDWPT